MNDLDKPYSGGARDKGSAKLICVAESLLNDLKNVENKVKTATVSTKLTITFIAKYKLTTI